MVVHSGDAEQGAPAWGDSEHVSYPSQISVEKVVQNEPFAFAEDLHLATLPLDLPKSADVVNESASVSGRGGAPVSTRVEPEAFRSSNASSESKEPCLDSSAAATLPRVDPVSPQGSSLRSFGAIQNSSLNASPLAQPIPLSKRSGVSAVRRRVLLSAAVIVVLVLGVGVFVARRSGGARSGLTEVAPSAVVVATTVAPIVTASQPVQATAPSSTSPSVSDVAAKKAEASVKTDVIVRVTVNLKPTDATLTDHGVAVAGPPYIVEVPKGKKRVFEAFRKGFVTRKVTVDSTKPIVNIGLVANRTNR
jgi:hypothetical protein